MPHLITSGKGEPHISSADARHYNAGTLGPGNYTLKSEGNLAGSLVDSNTFRILSGSAVTSGAHWRIEDAWEDYPVENGTPGYKRKDLVLAHIETYPKELCEIRVIKGTETTGDPVLPEHTAGDLNGGDTVAEMPLYAIPFDGINPGTPQPLFDLLVPYADFCDSISQVNEINQDGVRVVVGHGVATVSVTKTVSAPVWSTTRIATVPEPYRPSCSIGCVLLYAANNTFTPFPTTVYPDGGIAVSVYGEAINGEIYGSVTYPVAQTA